MVGSSYLHHFNGGHSDSDKVSGPIAFAACPTQDHGSQLEGAGVSEARTKVSIRGVGSEQSSV